MAKGGSGSGRKGGGGGGNATMSFDEFYNTNRSAPEPDSSFLRGRANVSNAAIRRQDARYRQQVDAKYNERASLRSQYNDLVASGQMSTPSRIQSLIQKARGNPDNQSTQAARRILDRQGINY